MKHLILYLSAITASCTCVAADFSGTVSAEVLLGELFARENFDAQLSDDLEDGLSTPQAYVLIPLKDDGDGDTNSSAASTPSIEYYDLLYRQAQDETLARLQLEQRFEPEDLTQDFFVPQDVLGAPPPLPPEENYYYDESMDTDSVAASTPSTEDPGSEEVTSRVEKCRIAEALSRKKIARFRDALMEELDMRSEGTGCTYQRAKTVRCTPRGPDESQARYRQRYNRTCHENRRRELQSMISDFSLLDRKTQIAIIGRFQDGNIPHVKRLFRLLRPAAEAQLIFEQHFEPENSSGGKTIRPPDSVYDNLFFDELHKQLKARDFRFLPTDRTRRNKLLAMFTAYHELPDSEQNDIIEALKNAGISRAAWRLRTTPEELRERQERKNQTRKASARRMKELRSTQEYDETSDFVS